MTRNQFCITYNISQTVIPEIDQPLENGYTKEEQKMINETRKILHQPALPVSATCVRVPIENGHGVSVAVQLQKSLRRKKLEVSQPVSRDSIRR